MICSKCGATLPEGTAFCHKCGVRVSPEPQQVQARQADVPAANGSQNGYNTGSQNGYNGGNNAYGNAVPNAVNNNFNLYTGQEKRHLSVGDWMLRSLIVLIPFVGWLIYLIMLFVWSGDKTYDDTFRNWAKAQLIWMAIAVGIILLILIFTAILGAGLYSALL